MEYFEFIDLAKRNGIIYYPASGFIFDSFLDAKDNFPLKDHGLDFELFSQDKKGLLPVMVDLNLLYYLNDQNPVDLLFSLISKSKDHWGQSFEINKITEIRNCPDFFELKRIFDNGDGFNDHSDSTTKYFNVDIKINQTYGFRIDLNICQRENQNESTVIPFFFFCTYDILFLNELILKNITIEGAIYQTYPASFCGSYYEPFDINYLNIFNSNFPKWVIAVGCPFNFNWPWYEGVQIGCNCYLFHLPPNNQKALIEKRQDYRIPIKSYSFSEGTVYSNFELQIHSHKYSRHFTTDLIKSISLSTNSLISFSSNHDLKSISNTITLNHKTIIEIEQMKDYQLLSVGTINFLKLPKKDPFVKQFNFVRKVVSKLNISKILLTDFYDTSDSIGWKYEDELTEGYTKMLQENTTSLFEHPPIEIYILWRFWY